MKEKVQLRWSDAWILAAIYHCAKEKSANLAEILAAADSINHAVLNLEELQSGLFRLEHAGLIHGTGTQLCFQCTGEAIERIEPLLKQSKSGFQLWKELESNLGVSPWIPGEPVPHPENIYCYPGLNTAVYQEAVENYLNRIGRAG